MKKLLACISSFMLAAYCSIFCFAWGTGVQSAPAYQMTKENASIMLMVIIIAAVLLFFSLGFVIALYIKTPKDDTDSSKKDKK